ncbi:MAG: hypothetical protein ABI045_04845 [Flavobacteriales bacterium]
MSDKLKITFGGESVLAQYMNIAKDLLKAMAFVYPSRNRSSVHHIDCLPRDNCTLCELASNSSAFALGYIPFQHKYALRHEIASRIDRSTPIKQAQRASSILTTSGPRSRSVVVD